MSAAVEVERILKVHGAVLRRHRKHLVWRFPALPGRYFVQSATPSDVNAEHQQLRDLKRILGLNGVRGLPGERRERSYKPGRPASIRIHSSANTAMLEAMQKVGLIEETLNVKISALTEQLRASRRANRRKKNQLRQFDAHCKNCWGCALARWVRNRPWLNKFFACIEYVFATFASQYGGEI